MHVRLNKRITGSEDKNPTLTLLSNKSEDHGNSNNGDGGVGRITIVGKFSKILYKLLFAFPVSRKQQLQFLKVKRILLEIAGCFSFFSR